MLTIKLQIATKAEWNQWNRTESLDACVHQWREVDYKPAGTEQE